MTPVFGPFSHRAPLYIVSGIGGSAVPLTMAYVLFLFLIFTWIFGSNFMNSWMAELISDNAEQRAFTAAAMNTLQCRPFSLLLGSKADNSQIHSQHGFPWFGSNKSTSLTVRSTLPFPTFRCTDFKIVTPGNRAAAVVGGFNVIVFTIIAILDHREKKQKRRNGELTRASVLADSPTTGSVDGSEKRLPLGGEEDISPVRKE